MLLRAAKKEEEEEGAVSYSLIPLLWRTRATNHEAPREPSQLKVLKKKIELLTGSDITAANTPASLKQ